MQALLDLCAKLCSRQLPPVTDRETRTRKNVRPLLVGPLFASVRKKRRKEKSRRADRRDRSLRLSGAFNFTHDLHAALSSVTDHSMLCSCIFNSGRVNVCTTLAVHAYHLRVYLLKIDIFEGIKVIIFPALCIF